MPARSPARSPARIPCPLTLRWIYTRMIEELARHSGHADILREQLLAARESVPPPTTR